MPVETIKTLQQGEDVSKICANYNAKRFIQTSATQRTLPASTYKSFIKGREFSYVFSRRREMISIDDDTIILENNS